MKALLYHGPGERSWDGVPDPPLEQPTDAIVRIDSSTISVGVPETFESAPTSCGPAATSPTSAYTGARLRSIWRSCGSETSRS